MAQTSRRFPLRFPRQSRINCDAFIERRQDGAQTLVIRLDLVEAFKEELALEFQKTGSLTNREHQVADGILHYRGNKEIAADLGISERMVKFHVGNILAKYQIKNRWALHAAIREGREPFTALL